MNSQELEMLANNVLGLDVDVEGHTINYEVFKEISLKTCAFTPSQIIHSNLPKHIVYEIATDGWRDTQVMDELMDHLALEYLGEVWPSYYTPEDAKDKFYKKLQKFKDESNGKEDY